MIGWLYSCLYAMISLISSLAAFLPAAITVDGTYQMPTDGPLDRAKVLCWES